MAQDGGRFNYYRKLKPEYVIHGDDWYGPQLRLRDNVIKTLKNTMVVD